MTRTSTASSLDMTSHRPSDARMMNSSPSSTGNLAMSAWPVGRFGVCVCMDGVEWVDG